MKRLLAALLPLYLTLPPVSAIELGDPTRPSDAITADAPQAIGTWRLNATRIGPNRRTAIINGIQVAEGGEIGGARVLRIRHAQVQLQAQNEILTLQLQPAEVKKTR